MRPPATVIGIDCATQPKHVGLARGHIRDGKPVLQEVTVGDRNLVGTLITWLEKAEPTLLALDAPLGWPAAMGPVLNSHRAGDPVGEERARFFTRGTDRDVEKRVGVRPLKVGADLIAHTAHAALSLLDELRSSTGLSIPLAWTPELNHRAAAIEVYPAATLRERGLRYRGYKASTRLEERQEILTGLASAFGGGLEDPRLRQNADLLDACVCVLAGADFLAGRSRGPTDMKQARREGWIWVRGTGDE